MPFKEKSECSFTTCESIFPFGKKDNILRFAKIIENSFEGITLLNKDLQIIYRTNSAERISGWADSDLLLREIDRLIHPSDSSWLVIFLAELRNIPGQSKICCFRLKHKNGNFIWVECVFTNSLNEPEIAAIVCNFRDITSRKNAESATALALQNRNMILESIDDAFFILDTNWQVKYWNKTAEKLLGTPRNAILNQNFWVVFSSDLLPKSHFWYHEAFKSNQAVKFEEYYSVVEKWFDINAYPSEGGLSVLFKDITERKISDAKLNDLNENLNERAKELALANAELEQFAYVASHDLQEPLRMVTSFLCQLEKKYADRIDQKGKQYIFFAVDGARRMRQIILDLLEFSRVGRTDDNLEEVDMKKLVNEIRLLFHRQMKELKAVLTVSNMPTIVSYKTPLRQVIQNLVSNCLKYHSPGIAPRIKIKSTTIPAGYRFAVSDNGIGIEPENFEKIFSIFQRLHQIDELPGTGMGLAITKKIVENLGGKIWVESKVGKGTTFYFTVINHNK